MKIKTAKMFYYPDLGHDKVAEKIKTALRVLPAWQRKCYDATIRWFSPNAPVRTKYDAAIFINVKNDDARDVVEKHTYSRYNLGASIIESALESCGLVCTGWRHIGGWLEIYVYSE